MSNWQEEREKKRVERDMKRFVRRMSTPVARGEVYQLGELQVQHIASIALALEALEDILVGRGLVERDELLDTMHVIAARKAEVAAAQAVSESSLIATV